MTIDETNLLHKKAETRKNGVYSFKGNYWVVKDNKFVAFADYFGNCYQRFGSFNASIGNVESYNRKQKLTEWLYPTKEERLDRDVEIRTIKNRIGDTYDAVADYYLAGWGTYGEFHETPRLKSYIGITVLNENIRNMVKDFCIKFRDLYDDEIKKNCPSTQISLKVDFVKQKLIEWLYPEEEYEFFDEVQVNKNPVNKTRVLELF